MRRLVLLLATILACDPDETHTAVGTAPVVGDVQVTPTDLTVGISNMLQGDVPFTDREADVDTLEITIVTPTGERSSMDVDVADAADKPEGTVAFIIAIAPPTAGTYALELGLVDAEGNVSEAVTVELTAT